MINCVEPSISNDTGLGGPRHERKQAIPLKREGREVPNNVRGNELETKKTSVIACKSGLSLCTEFRKDLKRKWNI